MRTAFIELVRGDEDNRSHPMNQDKYKFIDPEKAKHAIRILNSWNFEEIVFVADDVLVHSEFWDIYDYAANDLRVESIQAMTNGQFLTREDMNEFNYRSAISPVLPLDFKDPFTGQIYGYRDYNNQMEKLLQRMNIEIWQTIMQDNLNEVMSMIQRSTQYGLNWRGHLINEFQPPDEMMNVIQSNELPLLTPDNWLFVHCDKNIPDIEHYIQEIVRNRNEYTGTLHVNIDGIVSSVQNNVNNPIYLIERNDLSDFAL